MEESLQRRFEAAALQLKQTGHQTWSRDVYELLRLYLELEAKYEKLLSTGSDGVYHAPIEDDGSL